MQRESTPKTARSARAPVSISRRAFFAGAGAIAVAPASAGAQSCSLHSQLDDCLKRLKTVLGKLYPETTVHSGLTPIYDGASFTLAIFGVLDRVDWSGNAFYEVRNHDEALGGVYYVKQIIGRWGGEPLLSGARMVNGVLGPFIIIRPELLRRKLEGGAI